MLQEAFAEAMIKQAVKSFEKELENPNSTVYKRFQSILKGDPTKGVRGLYDDMLEPGFGQPQQVSPEEQEKALQDNLGRYKRTAGQKVLDAAGTVTANVAEGAGNAWNMYHDLLGDALLAMSKPQQSQYWSPVNEGSMLPYVLGMKAKGGVGKIVGDTVGKSISEIQKRAAYERERDKETEILLREHPNGLYFDAQRKLSQGQYRK